MNKKILTLLPVFLSISCVNDKSKQAHIANLTESDVITEFRGDVPFLRYAIEDFPHKRFAFIPYNGRQLLIHVPEYNPKQILEDLAKWTISRGERANPSAVKVVTSPVTVKSTIALDVTDILPRIALDYNFEYTWDHNPNCWNFTLITAGFTEVFDTTSAFAFSEFLSDPLVKKIDSESELKQGDIIAYRKIISNEKREIHAATFISKDLYWTKNGVYEDIPFRLMDSEEVHGTYLKKKESTIENNIFEKRECSKIGSEKLGTCHTFVEAFRVKIDGEKFLATRPEIKENLNILASLHHMRFFGDKITYINDQETYTKLYSKYGDRVIAINEAAQEVRNELVELIEERAFYDPNITAEEKFFLKTQLAATEYLSN